MSKTMILDPDWYDGTLLSVALGRVRTLTLGGYLYDDKAFEMTVTGLLAMRVERLTEYNVVDEVSVADGRDCPGDLIDFMANDGPMARKRILKMLEEPSARVLVVGCVTECRLVALFSGDVYTRAGDGEPVRWTG